MSNPYTSPDSDISSTRDPWDYNATGWKVLFFLFVIGETSLIAMTYAAGEVYFETTYDLIFTAFYAVSYICFFGLAFKKQFLKPAIWLVYLVAHVIYSNYEVIPTLIEEYEFIRDIEDTTYVFIMVFFAAAYYALAMVQWWAVWKYAKVLKAVSK